MKTTRRRGALTLVALPLAVIAGACGGSAVSTPAPSPSPGAAADDAAATITPADMGRHIGALAHDSMRGRDTPSPELEKAAVYLAARFEDMGLEPAGEDGTFIHRYDYELSRLVSEETRVRVQGQASSRYERDFFLVTGSQPSTEAPAFYAGVAGETGTLPGEARGSIVVIDHPVAELGQEWQQTLMAALQPAMMGGAAGLMVVLHPEFPADMIQSLAAATAPQEAPFPIVGITDEAARELVASAGADPDAVRSGEPGPIGDATFEITSRRTQESHTPPNVVAMLRGSDPSLRDSYVVVTAHFDHVGVGAPDETGDSIFNGADDDASGTSAVLEIAEAFAALPQAPARSVVFLAVSGEEKGLLGSQAWVEHPTVPVEEIVANVNIDMIGRNAPDTLIGIGQEYSSLEGVVQGITDTYPELGLNVILDPVPEEMYFFRSDQLPFIQRGIPAVFFTTGDHEDYHQQSDNPDTVDTDKAARVARLAFYLAHAIATDPQAPEWTDEGWQTVEQMIQQSPF